MKKIIGIATYKREKYLEKTLESLHGQADEIRIYNNANLLLRSCSEII